MGIISWLRNKILDGQITYTAVDNAEFFSLAADAYIRELAFQSAVNLIANAVSKCEFKTYFRKKEQKGREYYSWNVEPNKNQNSSAFLGKLIHKLYEENECLVIETLDGQILVADSFQKKTYAVYDYVFSQVTVEDFTFERSYVMSEVMYFRLHNTDVRRVINGLAESYGKLTAYAMEHYQKAKGSKGILDISTTAQGHPKFLETFEKLMNERFKNFFKADSAVLPLFDGYKYTDVTAKTNTETTRDIKAMVNDIYDFTARALSIPPSLLLGEVADNSKAVDLLLTLCIDPLCDMMQEEINRKRSGYAGFSVGTYLKIYTAAMKHIDLFDVAVAIDKLIGSGAFCINDIRIAAGEEPIDEPWAWQHFMTKNYSTVADLLAALKGGETV